MFRKTFISSLILASLVLPVSPISAQTFSTEQQASLDSIKQQLIDLLVAQIALLQEQINDLLAKQTETSEAVSNLSVQESEVVLGAEESPTPAQRAYISIGGGFSNAFQIVVDNYGPSDANLEVVSYPDSFKVVDIEDRCAELDSFPCAIRKNLVRKDTRADFPNDGSTYSFTIQAFGQEYSATLKAGESKVFLDTR